MGPSAHWAPAYHKAPPFPPQAGNPMRQPFPHRDSAEEPGLLPPHVTLAHTHPHGAAPREGNRKRTWWLLEHKPVDDGNALRATSMGKQTPSSPRREAHLALSGSTTHLRKCCGLQGTAGGRQDSAVWAPRKRRDCAVGDCCCEHPTQHSDTEQGTRACNVDMTA